MHRNKALLALLALMLGAGGLRAQGFSLGLRGGGGFPLGDFASTSASTGTANQAVLSGAKSGFGYGLDAGLSMGFIGVYAGFDHVQFNCQDTQCGSDGKYTLGGVSGGLRLTLVQHGMIRPWVKGGVTFADLNGSYGSGSSNTLTTDRAPGYEIAGGIDVPFLGLLAFSPQVRYVGQNAKFRVPGVTVNQTQQQQTLSYLKLELGLSLAPMLGGMGRH
jgi:hypothetical protein